MKRTPSIALIGVMLIALGVIAVAAFVAWNRIVGDGGPRQASESGFTSNVKIGGPFSLTGHHGKPVSDGDFRGRLMLVYFGYGYCPDVCPTELANLAAAVDALGSKSAEVQPIFITIDPERDTVGFLADYVPQFHPRMVGLTGSQAEIASVAKQYRVFYQKTTDPGATDYLMNHSGFIYLMGRDGAFLTMFRGATKPQAIADTIGTYIARGAQG